MKKISTTIKVVFVAALMLIAAVSIMAGDVIFQDGGLQVEATQNTMGNVEFLDHPTQAGCSGFRKVGSTGGFWDCS